MTPEALLAYLLSRGISEDAAQDTIVEYLEGKMAKAANLKGWAFNRARWRQIDEYRNSRPYSLPLEAIVPTYHAPGLNPEEQCTARQIIDRFIQSKQAADPTWDPITRMRDGYSTSASQRRYVARKRRQAAP